MRKDTEDKNGTTQKNITGESIQHIIESIHKWVSSELLTFLSLVSFRIPGSLPALVLHQFPAKNILLTPKKR